jgi:transketolase
MIKYNKEKSTYGGLNMNKQRLLELKKIATDIRIGAVDAVYNAKSGHPGGALSASDIMACLYFSELRINPENPSDPERDRFVLSKGHSCPALYSAMAHKGYFPVEDLKGFRHLGTAVQGHPDMKSIKGIDMSAGSLGQGFSCACGMALAGKLDKKDYRVYAIMGDGEIEEGQVWEAMMAGAKYKLDNLCAFVDVNGLQIDGPTSVVMPTEPLDEKFASFGWNVIKIDGHDFDQIEEALNKAAQTKGVPTAVIMKTTKGKGVSFMEDEAGWHGKAPDDDQYRQAMDELGKQLEEVEAM